MKHLKLFENTKQYESYTNGSDYVLPNVSYVKETKGVRYERKKAYILRAKYDATPDNLVAFTGASNIKALNVNGTPIEIEPIKNEITTFDVLGENISMNMDTGEATFPESYLIKSPVSNWSFKAKDPNYTINENTYICMLGMMDGMTIAQPMPFEEIMGYAFTTNDGVTLEAIDTFLSEMSTQIQSGIQISFTLVDMDVNNGTFTFIDTEHQTNVTTGGLPTYSFDSEGLYDVKIELDDPVISMQFNGTPLTSIEISGGITSIGSSAFYSCYRLTSVTIGNSVTEIGEEAFEYCNNLTSIIIPDSVRTIGRMAFYGCYKLTSVTIPNSVTTIEGAAFGQCSSLQEFNGKFVSEDGRCLIIDGTLKAFAPVGLTEYTIPNSITTIGERVFQFCDDLTSVTVPNGITTIGELAFGKCSRLTSVNIPDGVTSIGEFAFFECTKLESVNIPDGVTTIGMHTFDSCKSLTNIAIPNSVTTIGEEAFYDCQSLKSVTIPNSVTEIGKWAFNRCYRLTSVYCEATTPPSLGGSDVFYGNASSRTIYVPEESVNAYKSATNWSVYASAIVGYEF